MTDAITKHQRTQQAHYAFTVLIPAWNNVAFIENCVNSIRKHSRLAIQIVVIVNEGKDGTIDWLESRPKIDCVHARHNIGICYVLNIARPLAKSEYLVYVNDDMYVLPNWDTILHGEIVRTGHTRFMLSCTMIEPTDTGNACVVVKHYGQDLARFQEALLLQEYASPARADWSGSTWPPNLVHVDMWDLVGGLGIGYSPGMYSDPDFSRKFFEAGMRHFQGKGDSVMYHFGSKSTKRAKKNKGRETFLLKWGTTANTFARQYPQIGKPFAGALPEPVLDTKTRFANALKRAISCL